MGLGQGQKNFVKMLENEDYKKGFSSALGFMQFQITEEFKINDKMSIEDRINLLFKTTKAIVDIK